jgi:Bacterial regulatory proteins, tetR family
VRVAWRPRLRFLKESLKGTGRPGFSLNQIMAGAGLTHGGFYSYFNSKSDLYAAVLGCFFTDPEWKSCWEGVHVDLSSTDVGPQVVRAYLSRQHFTPRAAGSWDQPTARGGPESTWLAAPSMP